MAPMSELTAPTRQQKITFGEMRSSGVRGLLIYCWDYHCSHSTAISGDRWPGHIGLSDLEPLFVCQACGQRVADIRPIGIGHCPGGALVADRGWRRRFDAPI